MVRVYWIFTQMNVPRITLIQYLENRYTQKIDRPNNSRFLLIAVAIMAASLLIALVGSLTK
jgi:hypothetical protein